jgi:hypothetical protein
VDLTIPEDFLHDRYFHVQVDRSALLPDHDIAAYRDGSIDGTVESRFVRRLLAALDEAETAERKAMIERALYYGLDALRYGKVQPRYVD